MRNIWPALVCALLVAAAGIQHGMSTDRWRPSTGVAEAVEKLGVIPTDLKNWHGTKEQLDEADLARSGIKGTFSCQYRNTRTGAIFNVLVVCGKPGPISVHTPDICYEGAGFEAFGSPELRDVRIGDGEPQPFWSLRFRKPNSSVNASQLEIIWVWNDGDGWAAPANSRLKFAHAGALYKLYVAHEVSPRDKGTVADHYSEFLTEFLPELTQALARSSAQ